MADYITDNMNIVSFQRIILVASKDEDEIIV